jgi:hypothetical protein
MLYIYILVYKLISFKKLQHCDAEICKELEPHGFTHVKRFISLKTGQEIKLNTFLITFSTPNIPTSIRINLYNVRVYPYIPGFFLLRMVKFCK